MMEQIWLKSGGLNLAGEVYFPPGNKLCPALCICHGIPNVAYNPADRVTPYWHTSFALPASLP